MFRVHALYTWPAAVYSLGGGAAASYAAELDNSRQKEQKEKARSILGPWINPNPAQHNPPQFRKQEIDVLCCAVLCAFSTLSGGNWQLVLFLDGGAPCVVVSHGRIWMGRKEAIEITIFPLIKERAVGHVPLDSLIKSCLRVPERERESRYER